MEFKGITYLEKQPAAEEILQKLPEELQSFYRQINGVVAYQGGLHIRGCVSGPSWHSLEAAWIGPSALHHTYEGLTDTDIPFAQDCMGDQFFWRQGNVWTLMGETGELEDLEVDFEEFLEEVVSDPVEFLSLHPLVDFLEQVGPLQPGSLLHVSPPFSLESEEEAEYTFEDVTAAERHTRLGEIYRGFQEG